MAYKQVFGTSGDDHLFTDLNETEIVFLQKGDDTVACDFKSVDYIIDTGGNDVLVTGGSFDDFSIIKHAGVKDAYIVRSRVEGGKANIVKGIETFRFTEGDASLDDFLEGIAPQSELFDKVIGLGQFIDDQYQAEDGVSEKFIIDLNIWNSKPELEINGFNIDEDQLVISSDIYSAAQQFADDNPAGAAGAWGWSNDTINIYNLEFCQLALTAVSGSDGHETIIDAESQGWLKFGREEAPPVEVAINLSNFIDSSFTALDGVTEIITIPVAEWKNALTVDNFDIDHDKLIINSNGEYTSAKSFMDANVAGSQGAFGYDVDGGAHIYHPVSFDEINLSGIADADYKPSLTQAETEGWIQFI